MQFKGSFWRRRTGCTYTLVVSFGTTSKMVFNYFWQKLSIMKKRLLTALVVTCLSFSSFLISAQNSVSIGTTTINPRAVLLLVGNNQQGLIIPIADHTRFTPGSSDSGMIIFDSVDRTIYYWDGNAWKSISSSSNVTYTPGAGISINGNTISNSLPDRTVTITGNGSASVTGIYPDFTVSSSDSQTLNLTGPNLSIARGNTLDLSGLNTDSQSLSLSGATGSATTAEVFNLNVTNGGGITIKEGNNISISRNVNELTFNANSGGTVSSVGLTMPSIFSITGSPINSTGSIDVSLNNQLPNQFLAGPSSGSASVPSFRSIALSDLPLIDGSKIQDGAIADVDIGTTANINGTKIDPNFGAQNISTTGNASINTLNISSELNQNITGTANMIPYAYGSILNNGGISQSSGNISVVKSATGTFDIAVTGVTPSSGDIVVATQFHFFTVNPCFIASTVVSSKIRIYTYDLTGALTDLVHFSFVAYKP